MLGLATTNTLEVSLARERKPVPRVCILCKLYLLYTQMYALCPQGCKDNLPKVDGIIQVVFLSLQIPSVSLLLFTTFLKRKGIERPDQCFYCSSCEPYQLCAVAFGESQLESKSLGLIGSPSTILYVLPSTRWGGIFFFLFSCFLSFVTLFLAQEHLSVPGSNLDLHVTINWIFNITFE